MLGALCHFKSPYYFHLVFMGYIVNENKSFRRYRKDFIIKVIMLLYHAIETCNYYIGLQKLYRKRVPERINVFLDYCKCGLTKKDTVRTISHA